MDLQLLHSNRAWKIELCVDHVISTGRWALKLVLNVDYLLPLFFLTSSKFCSFRHLQGIEIISFELRHPYRRDLYFFQIWHPYRSDLYFFQIWLLHQLSKTPSLFIPTSLDIREMRVHTFKMKYAYLWSNLVPFDNFRWGKLESDFFEKCIGPSYTVFQNS